MKMAFNIYKESADFEYDYLCMYRMHRIYLFDYNDFGVKKNEDLHRLYLYKCFAYLPNLNIQKHYYLLNKIDVAKQLEILLDKFENNKCDIFDKFMIFLKNNKKVFNLTLNDILLISSVFKSYFSSESIIEEEEHNNNLLEDFLKFKKEDGESAYFEAQLKYCNFALEYYEVSIDKEKIKNIFKNLIKEEYYKAACDYGRFLIYENENEYEEAKNIFKIGYDNSQQYCLLEYTYIYLKTIDFNQIFIDYNEILSLLKRMCLIICFDKTNHGSFYYMLHYLIKHSSIQNEYTKYALEIYKNEEKYFKIENNELIYNILSTHNVIEHLGLFGNLCFYGIGDTIKSDKEKALIYFKKSYKLAKENENGYFLRLTYVMIYKCRKYLYKNNKIPLKKLNKTKEKLLRLYEESNISWLDSSELYHYYQLYKNFVNEYTKDKLISILEKGKDFKKTYHFRNFVYIEKCKKALEKENSDDSSLNQNNIILKNENFNENDINLCFETNDENKKYNIRVAKNIQFILALSKLCFQYPELKEGNLFTYKCNENKLYLYDTIEENGLQDGNIILIIK